MNFPLKDPASGYFWTLVALSVLIVPCASCDSVTDNAQAATDESVARSGLLVETLPVIRSERPERQSAFFGRLVPARETIVSFDRGGTISRVQASVSDAVSEGQLLAALDVEEIQQARDELEEEREQATVELEGLGTAPADQGRRQSLEQQIEQFDAQMVGLDKQLEQGELLAPFDCVVLERWVDPADKVAPNAGVFRIAESVLPLVEAELPQSIASRIPARYQILVLHGNIAYKGITEFVEPQVDRAGNQRLRISMPQAIGNVRWTYNQTVEIRFSLPLETSGFWIPYSSLRRKPNGLWSVLVVEQKAGSSRKEQGELVEALVDIIHFNDSTVLVSGNLDGQRIVADGLHRVTPGQQVRFKDVSGVERDTEDE